MSINYLSKGVGSYPTVYYLIKSMMIIVYNLPSKKLFGTVEHDEAYVRAGSKGTKIDGKDGRHTVPSRRGLPRGPGRGTYNKDLPMVTVVYQRADKTTRDCVVYNVHKGKKLADIVKETVKPGSTVYTDEYKAYSSLGKRGYEHEPVNHSEGEYASGKTTRFIQTTASAWLDCLNGGKRSIVESASRTYTFTQSPTSSYGTIAIATISAGCSPPCPQYWERIAGENITTSTAQSLPN